MKLHLRRLLLIYILLGLLSVPALILFLEAYGILFEALGICKADDLPVLYASLATTFTIFAFLGTYFGTKKFKKGKLGFKVRLRVIVALSLLVGFIAPAILFGIAFLIGRLVPHIYSIIVMRSLRVVGSYPVREQHYVLQQKLIILPPGDIYTSQLFTVKSTIMDIKIKSRAYNYWYGNKNFSTYSLEVKIARTLNAYSAPLSRDERFPFERLVLIKKGSCGYSLELRGSGNQPFEIRVLDGLKREVVRFTSVKVEENYEIAKSIRSSELLSGISYQFYIVVKNLGVAENAINIDAYLKESYEIIIVEFLDPLIAWIPITACIIVPIVGILIKLHLSTRGIPELDDIDLRIIRALRKGDKKTLDEIAQEAGVSHETASKRIKKFIEYGYVKFDGKYYTYVADKLKSRNLQKQS